METEVATHDDLLPVLHVELLALDPEADPAVDGELAHAHGFRGPRRGVADHVVHLAVALLLGVELHVQAVAVDLAWGEGLSDDFWDLSVSKVHMLQSTSN